jgi:hypothetical protein
MQWPRLSAEDRQRAKPEGRTRFHSRLRANFTCWADKGPVFLHAVESALYCDMSFRYQWPIRRNVEEQVALSSRRASPQVLCTCTANQNEAIVAALCTRNQREQLQQLPRHQALDSFPQTSPRSLSYSLKTNSIPQSRRVHSLDSHVIHTYLNAAARATYQRSNLLSDQTRYHD